MPNLLALALGKPIVTVGKTVSELEHLSGYPSEDGRLISDLAHSSRWQIAQLGLDPLDTTAKELYQSLFSAFELTAQVFAEAVGEPALGDFRLRYAHLGQVLAKLGNDGEVWALKKDFVAKLLKNQPPRRVMKQLGYRSVGSMLKRQDPRMILAAATTMEPSRWQKARARFIGSLASSSFEIREPTCLVMPEKLWSGSTKRRPLVFGQPEAGLVVVWPNHLAPKTPSLGVLALCMKQLEQLHNLSASLDMHYLNPELGKLADRLWRTPGAPAFSVGSLNFSWQALGETDLQTANELQGERRPGISCRQNLIRLHPALHWWATNEYLIFVDEQSRPVSLNLVDTVINHAAGNSFAKRTITEARSQLSDELARRYLRHAPVSDLIQQKLTVQPQAGRKTANSGSRLQLAGAR